MEASLVGMIYNILYFQDISSSILLLSQYQNKFSIFFEYSLSEWMNDWMNDRLSLIHICERTGKELLRDLLG